jgi:hypothetical protein
MVLDLVTRLFCRVGCMGLLGTNFFSLCPSWLSSITEFVGEACHGGGMSEAGDWEIAYGSHKL